jgi:hypothetical protein
MEVSARRVVVKWLERFNVVSVFMWTGRGRGRDVVDQLRERKVVGP